jgi:hypothetical protein
MKKVISFAINSILLAIFVSMILLPIGFMGKMKYENDSTVLSAQDYSDEKSSIKSLDDPDANIPEDVEEFIMRMEREYYRNQETQTDTSESTSAFKGDIEREESLEDTNDINTNDTKIIKTDQ